jgi:hypothetical protein
MHLNPVLFATRTANAGNFLGLDPACVAAQ